MHSPSIEENLVGLPLSTHVLTEAAARRRFKALLDEQHTLGAPQAKGRRIYQVIARGNQWLGLMLWSGACWHLKDRDEWIGWDAPLRSERLSLVIYQSRFLILEETRAPNLASQLLAASVRDLPKQWEECFGYRPLLAETFTDPECHAGTCYKAAGWLEVGFSARDGRHYGQKFPEVARPKKLWLKPLHAKAREHLIARELPPWCAEGVAAHTAERCLLKVAQLESLRRAFQRVRDPRTSSGRRYSIGAVLTLVALGLLRGAVHLSQIVRTAQKLTQAQRQRLDLPLKKGTRFHSVPGYDVFREVLRRADLEDLALVLTQWLQAHAGALPRTLAVDGKTIRDHLGLIVALVDTEEGMPVAVAANLHGKGHELKTTQVLLASAAVNLEHAIVTADSLHCQDRSAHIITREKGGDYVFQIRDNQPTLHQHAQQQLAQTAPFFPPPTPDMDESKRVT